MVEASLFGLLVIALLTSNLSAGLFASIHLIYATTFYPENPCYYVTLATANYIIFIFTPSSNPMRCVLLVSILFSLFGYAIGGEMKCVSLILNITAAMIIIQSHNKHIRSPLFFIYAAIIVALGFAQGSINNGMVRNARSNSSFRVNNRAFNAVAGKG